jgi:hypothetical protein
MFDEPRVMFEYDVVVPDVDRRDGHVHAQIHVDARMREGVGRTELCRRILIVAPTNMYEACGQVRVAARRLIARALDITQPLSEIGRILYLATGERDEGVGQHRHRPGSVLVDIDDICRRLQQDPMADSGGPGVPLDARSKLVHVGTQQRIAGVA